MSDDVTMRMSPLLSLVLVAAVALLTIANANTETRLRIDSNTTVSSSPSSLSSSLNHITKRDQVIAGIEASLLTFLGLSKRPKPQGSPYIPESLKKLYNIQNSIGTADIAKPGIHARSANVVRSFYHVGEWACNSVAARCLASRGNARGNEISTYAITSGINSRP